jgi:PAS domain S-box-containing protein
MIGKQHASPDRIDRNIAFRFGAVVLLLILTSTGAATFLFSRLQTEEEDRLTGAITAILGESISRVTFSGKYQTRLLVEDMLARIPDLAYISVETPEGRILASSDPALDDTEVSKADAETDALSLHTGSTILKERSSPTAVVKEVVTPYRGGFGDDVLGVVRVGVRVDNALKMQRTNLLKLLVLVAALTAVAIAAIYHLSRRFGGSIRVLGWQLQGILNHAPLGIAISGQDGSLRSHSAELEHILGPTRAVADLETILSRHLPASADRALDDMERQVPDKSRKIEQELAVETPGGVRFWQVSKFPIAQGPLDEAILSCTLIHDITEKKRAYMLLRESEERHRSVFEGANDAIFIMDGPVCIDCNAKGLALFACQKRDIIGKSVQNFSPEIQPDGQLSATKIRRFFENALQGYPQVFEWQHLTLDGRCIYAEVSLSAITVFDKPCLQAIARDITQRKESEERLRQSEEKFSQIFELAPDCIIITRLSDKTALAVNSAFEAITGYTCEEILGRSTDSLNLWVEACEHRKFFESLSAGNRLDSFSFKIRNKSGMIRDCCTSSQLTVISGDLCALSVFRDVTETIKMQEVMVQTEKMMSVGGLAAGMAHEINNPLSGILQGIQVVQRRLQADSPRNQELAARAGCSLDSIRQFLEERDVLATLQDVRDSGIRAAKIVSNMLEFSRKESGKSSTSIHAIIDRAVELCSNDYDLKKNYDFRKIHIERDYDLSIPLVPCTANQIEQVLMNLLRNAAQAMADRGSDAPRPRIVLRTFLEDDLDRIEVEDNGPGMAESVRKRIFEPFFTTKAPGIGTGLGLSVSYFIISSSHQGTIHVESTHRSGSKFVIRLPVGG